MEFANLVGMKLVGMKLVGMNIVGMNQNLLLTFVVLGSRELAELAREFVVLAMIFVVLDQVIVVLIDQVIVFFEVFLLRVVPGMHSTYRMAVTNFQKYIRRWVGVMFYNFVFLAVVLTSMIIVIPVFVVLVVVFVLVVL